VDLWLQYKCKYQGEFYITAVIPKDGISYLDFKLPKKMTLRNINKKCKGYSKKMLLLINDKRPQKYQGEKEFEYYGGDYGVWVLLCGKATVLYNRGCWGRKCHYRNEFTNDFESFVAISMLYEPSINRPVGGSIDHVS
jgi:hypothetical protein